MGWYRNVELFCILNLCAFSKDYVYQFRSEQRCVLNGAPVKEQWSHVLRPLFPSGAHGNKKMI